MGGIRYLLDTNILSEPLAKSPHTGVMEGIRRHAEEIALSAISWQEMLFGMRRLAEGKRRRQIEAYLLHRVRGVLPILPFDQAAAEWQAKVSAELASRGLTPAYADAQIAAIAATQGLILVTRNIPDFAGFPGLTLENWFTEFG
jgi:tRNA(fMet)-specific endonuclease VapC